ncbi:MAG TPA: hypothetical protein VNU68_28115 [Verrucomicrobiae bacterium]|jgi:hypothetical protein|nr:hypothetical protein [Verrucomicrobiae bacterium]
MTKHNKRKKKMELPCHWVDEAGFDVLPKNQPSKPSELSTDTAMILKDKTVPRSARAREG